MIAVDGIWRRGPGLWSCSLSSWFAWDLLLYFGRFVFDLVRKVPAVIDAAKDEENEAEAEHRGWPDYTV